MADEQRETFSAATSIQQRSSHGYLARFIPQYSNGSSAHGGFIASIFIRVAYVHFSTTLAYCQQPDLSHFHLQYLSSTALAEADLMVRDVKLGGRTSLIQVTSIQGGKEKGIAFITHSNMRSSVKAESKGNEISFPTNLSYELKNRILPRQLQFLSSSRSVKDNESTKLDRNPDHNSNLPATSPLTVAEPPSPPGEMSNDWIICHISDDSYSRTTTNIKFILPRNAATKAPPNASTVQYLLPAHSHPENRFTTASLGYICDMWPQLIDAFIPGSPYSAAGMVQATLALRQDAVENGIILNDESARQWVRYWYATTSMTVQVHRALPREGVDWLWTRVWAESIRDGRMDVRVVVADGQGTVAAGSLAVLVVERKVEGDSGAGKDGSGESRTKDGKRDSKI